MVCPLIEESETLQTASARQTYEDLAAGELAGFRLRLLHGQLPPAEKAAAMAAYATGEVDVLVSTSVIEVGVDVANATVMVIMGARRFGLSQLHQLRGRVGRGADESHCFLLAEGEDEAVLERLALFARTTDGFALAEADLLARGEGQLFGERQSGLGDLEVASLLRDRRLLEEAREEAEALLAERRRARSPGAPPRGRGGALRQQDGLDGAGVTARAAGQGAHRGRREAGPPTQGARGRRGAGRPARRCGRPSSTFSARWAICWCWICSRAPAPWVWRRFRAGPGAASLWSKTPPWRPCCEENIATLGYESVSRVIVSDYHQALQRLSGAGARFDLLFVDPPYRMLAEVEVTLGPLLSSLLRDDGVAVIEGDRPSRVTFGQTPVFDRAYGDTRVTMIRMRRSIR